MKIKRFNEDVNDIIEISPDRINDIVNELRQTLSILDDKNKNVEGFINEFNNYKSKSKKGNDQIDDSVLALQIVRKELSNSIDKIDTIINNLISYNDEGRKYLYTE